MKWPKLIVVGLSFSALFFAGAALINPSQALAATYTVTKTEDTNDGTCDTDCSLREAVEVANTNAGHDTIEFDIPDTDAGYVPASGDVHAYWKITINSPLTLTDNEGAFVNGYSQAGASRNTAPFGEMMNTVLTIQTYFNDDTYQLIMDLIASSNNHIAGLNIIKKRTNDASTLRILNGDNNFIEGNFFGSDIQGTTALGSATIRLENSNANVIGTDGDGVNDSAERNLFAGSGTQGSSGFIQLYPSGGGSHNNIIAGNYLGTTVTGSSCTGQPIGRNIIVLEGSTGNRIGTDYDGTSDNEEANIIGCVYDPYGTYRAIIRLLAGANNNSIQGNFIGISPHGDPLGSMFGSGVGNIDLGGGVSGNHIKGNTISNGAYGIKSSSTSVNNTFLQNRIFANELLDISVFSSTPLVNDLGDTDTGPNDLMNYPEIEGAEYLGGGRYKIWGWLEGNLAEAPFTIEVCKSSGHSSGYGGCLEPLGTITTSERMWSMEVTVPGDSEGNMSTFTALATNANGSTSEFGPNFGGSIHGPGAPAPTPKKPDLLAMHSGFVHRQEVLSFAPPATFLWDVYLDVAHTPQAGTKRVSGAYWQTSGIYNVWYKSFFNDAKILPEVISMPYLLALKYVPAKLEPNLPEKNLRLAYSEDGEVWKVLPNSVLDMVNKTVAVVTKQGGYYMLVSGYPF